MPVDALEHAFTVLDRWLLEVIQEHGAMTAQAFARETDARAAGSKHGVALSPNQVMAWLDSARRRGLLEHYALDLPGNPVEPPLWGLSELGRTRLAEATASTHFVPASVGKVIMPLLENAGKGLLGLASVYLAARAVKLIHHGVSVGVAQAAIIVLAVCGLFAYLVIRFTDNREALKEALATIQTSDAASVPPAHAQDHTPAQTGGPGMDSDQAVDRLNSIKHIVVVMMENRSFDHMLGHLSLEGMADVDGLKGDEFNLGPDKKAIPITAFDADAHHVQREGEALQKSLDPDHSKEGVQVQLGPGYGTDPSATNKGFVKAFVESRKKTDDVGPKLWMVPMGYYTGKDVPVYDHLAHNYCVCDAWHASVPGDTWPNRLYSLTGREGEKVHPSLLERVGKLLPGHALKALEGAPIFDVPAFTRQLDDEQWRWYSHDPATLRAADGHYRKFDDIKRENFAYFDRKKIGLVTEAAEELIVGHDSFLDDAARGRLRDVSWIDPNFIDLDVLDPNSNDDHPPTDIRAGQAFILDLYDALRRSPTWNDTLLVIVYDEHGGFYDHVTPPAVEDDSGYKTLGVRVPALIVGPRVNHAVCHQIFDHTTLIKTILTRFAKEPEQAIAQMPARVANAPHLGSVLAPEPRTDIPAPDGAGRPLLTHDFQDEFVKFALAMRHAGLPSGQP